jgi:pre-60S factor REI1
MRAKRREESDSDDSSGTDSIVVTASSPAKGAPLFNPQCCLFCNRESSSFEESLDHMQKGHGLFIPDRENLVVELETLVKYLHLVVFGYHECLACHSQRRTVQAAQQHMIGKGHCHFDVAAEDSEFRDFYDFANSVVDEGHDEDEHESDHDKETSDDDTSASVHTAKQTGGLHADEDGSARLSSGKLLADRHAKRKPRPGRQPLQPRLAPHTLMSISGDGLPQSPTAEPGVEGRSAAQSTDGDASTALLRNEERNAAFVSQIAQLSLNDQRSLAHLSTAEQRSLLVTQQKQVEMAKRAKKRWERRVEILGNKNYAPRALPGLPSI